MRKLYYGKLEIIRGAFMHFYIPTNIYVEKNCVQHHAKDVLALGKKALIVTGKHSAKTN